MVPSGARAPSSPFSSAVSSRCASDAGDGKKREGGLPIPLPSFGLGGEAGVGGEYDNGERFDLRLPYVDQGYEDPDADVMGKFMDLFKKKPREEE